MTHKQALQENGYLVFPGVVPLDLCQAVVKDIKLHLKDADSRSQPNPYGMVEMYHYQSMWNVRQYPLIRDAFTSLFGTDKLWVSIDRTGCKLPVPVDWRPQYDLSFGFMHWDICINQRPRPFEVQGVIALTDTDADMGGFQCMSGLYRELDKWLVKQPCGKARTSYVEQPYEHDVEVVPMKAGDLLVWDSFLPHGNGVNRGDHVRYAQYVTMMPVGDERLRQERRECWKTNSPPSGWAFPGDPRLLEQQKAPASLSMVGQKLLGLQEW